MALLYLAAVLAVSGCGDNEDDVERRRVFGGDAERGRIVIASIGCGVCHAIPGVRGARGTVGPPLAAFARRSFIAGAIPNEPELLIRWVRAAPDLVPNTAMPHLPVSEEEARHVSAYLYTLR